MSYKRFLPVIVSVVFCGSIVTAIVLWFMIFVELVNGLAA